MRDFNALPLSVQDEIKDLLKSYDKVHVVYEDKKYWLSLTTAVTDHYAFDTGRYIGTYYADDVFSPDERILNYVNSFHSYPVEYKGKKDWDMIRSLTWNDRVKFDTDHNIVKV